MSHPKKSAKYIWLIVVIALVPFLKFLPAPLFEFLQLNFLSHLDPVFFLLLIGVFLLCFGIWQIFREIAPRNWPLVPGIIVSVNLSKQYAGRGGYQYVPEIEYEYLYDDKAFRSSQRRPGNYTSGQLVTGDAICNRYPVGGKITVFVNPKNPARAFLEYGVTPLGWILIFFGVLFTLLGFAVING